MKRKYGYICGLLVVVLIVVSGCSGGGVPTVVENAINISLATAQNRDIAQNAGYAGTVRGINETFVMPKASSRVIGIHVKAGDAVRQGQVLVTLDSSDYQVGVRQAEASIATAQAALESAEAGKRANDISLENARMALERTRQLYEGGAVSDKDLEDAQSAYDRLNTGSIEASLAQAQAGLRQAQAGLQQAQMSIDNCSVTAPISGTVGSVSVSLGDTVSMQSPVASITNTSQLEVDIYVNESEISYIAVGEATEIHIKAAGEEPFSGRVSSVGTVPETGKNSYLVKVILDNPSGVIRSGMFAEVFLDTVSKNGVLALPINAVLAKGGRMVVYTVDEDLRARETEVTTGIKDKEYIEVTSGLTAGQEVVYLGNSLVSDGSLVQITAGGEQ